MDIRDLKGLFWGKGEENVMECNGEIGPYSALLREYTRLYSLLVMLNGHI